MIVLGTKEIAEHKSMLEQTAPFMEMFRKEIDAFCTYKDWKEVATDPILEMALEEIMEDEYLHARFLRDYMMDHDMFTVDSSDEYERKFTKIHKDFFHD